jgi:hypothetical protein
LAASSVIYRADSIGGGACSLLISLFIAACGYDLPRRSQEGIEELARDLAAAEFFFGMLRKAVVHRCVPSGGI